MTTHEVSLHVYDLRYVLFFFASFVYARDATRRDVTVEFGEGASRRKVLEGWKD